MLQSILRYLGLDAESRRLRADTAERLRQADAQLDQLQKRLEETSEITERDKKVLDKAVRQGGSRG